VKSKYRFTMMPYAFRVDAPGHDRRPVMVKLGPERLSIMVNDIRMSLTDWYRMANEVTRTLMDRWEPDPNGQVPTFHMKKWAEDQCGRAIGKRLRKHWERLRQLARPQALAVHKAMTSANWPAFHSQAAYSPRLYNEYPYVVKDVINYRAAAVAMNWMYTDNIERMQNWMAMYSCCDQPNGSLRRTLMNLPGGLPASLYRCMRLVELERPIFDRLELATLLLYAEITRYHYRVPNLHLVMHARRQDIKRAMALFSERRGCQYSSRKTLDIRHWVRYIADYPDTHDGNIVGLTQRTLEWHEQDRAEQARDEIARLGNITIQEPPALPDIPGIEFLDTADKIIEEGVSMGHCVAQYVRKASDGKCYLFHAEHGGTRATVELNNRLRVVQAYGPHNHDTPAGGWASKRLTKWADSLDIELPEQEEEIWW